MPDMKTKAYLPGTSVPGTGGNARTRRNGDGTYTLFVWFGMDRERGKLRDVGIYPTKAAAIKALREGTYGF